MSFPRQLNSVRYKGLEKRGAIDLFFMILEKVVIYGECLAWG